MYEFFQGLTTNSDQPQGAEAGSAGDLLAALAGSIGMGQPSAGGDLLGGLFSALLGGGADQPGGDAVTGLAEQMQLGPAVVQAVVALLARQLAGQGTSKAGGPDLAALLAQASSGEEVDEAALRARGDPGNQSG